MDETDKVLALNLSIKRIDCDFEATCDENAKLDVQEIIEFPTVFVSTTTGQVEFIFHTYVRPDVHPTLTSFCTELTGIEQGTVDKGISLHEALERHKAFINAHRLVPAFDAPGEATSRADENDGEKTFICATCGDWDLKTCLPKQLQYLKTACPRHLSSWCNLKDAFRQFYKIKPKGMSFMLNHCELPLEGRHHSGIDDCKNLARIVQKMLHEGWKVEGVTGTTLR